MPLNRFSSRRQRLYDAFLAGRLKGATQYDRIAGYFQSSLLGLAAGELKAIPSVRIVCNTEVNPADVHAIRQATGPRRDDLQEALLRLVWNDGRFAHLVDVYGEKAKERLRMLQDLVLGDAATGRRFQIRIVPDCEFGFIHGKAGVVRYADGRATSFIGSANDSERAWSANYELVWEDDTTESVTWVQEEFDALWARGFAISEFIVKQIGRLGQRTIIEHVGAWRQKPEVGPVLAEVPTCTELFGFWDHQKYFIKKAFDEHRRYTTLPGRGARYLLADGVGLGKTLQLDGLAKLIGTFEDDPILIVAPKAVVSQWQDELMDKDEPSPRVGHETRPARQDHDSGDGHAGSVASDRALGPAKRSCGQQPASAWHPIRPLARRPPTRSFSTSSRVALPSRALTTSGSIGRRPEIRPRSGSLAQPL